MALRFSRFLLFEFGGLLTLLRKAYGGQASENVRSLAKGANRLATGTPDSQRLTP
jgi:hypothetical protein